MKETRNQIEARINAQAWADSKFKETLKKNPKEALKEIGLNVPEHAKIVIHEEDANTWHLTLRKAPPNANIEELKKVSAGKRPGCSECGTC